MDDVAIHTAYYGAYNVRAAEAAAAAAVPRKGQGIACAFLAFSAACGLSTVAVGFFAHNPAITWPVVAVGLIGVVMGVALAHRRATGGCGTSSSSQHQHHVGGQAHLPAANVHVPYQTPIYYANALDVDVGVEVDGAQPPLFAKTAANRGGGVAMGTAVAVECGAVVCGVPLGGSDGFIDRKPVLVLQPHTWLARYLDQLDGQGAKASIPGQVTKGMNLPATEGSSQPPPELSLEPLRPDTPRQEQQQHKQQQPYHALCAPVECERDESMQGAGGAKPTDTSLQAPMPYECCNDPAVRTAEQAMEVQRMPRPAPAPATAQLGGEDAEASAPSAAGPISGPTPP